MVDDQEMSPVDMKTVWRMAQRLQGFLSGNQVTQLGPQWDCAESRVGPAWNRGQWLAHMCQGGEGYGRADEREHDYLTCSHTSTDLRTCLVHLPVSHSQAPMQGSHGRDCAVTCHGSVSGRARRRGAQFYLTISCAHYWEYFQVFCYCTFKKIMSPGIQYYTIDTPY